MRDLGSPWSASQAQKGGKRRPPSQSSEEGLPPPPSPKEQPLKLPWVLAGQGSRKAHLKGRGRRPLCQVGGGVCFPSVCGFSLFPQLCMVSLSLFRTLIGLHCEDVLLQLVLRYRGWVGGSSQGRNPLRRLLPLCPGCLFAQEAVPARTWGLAAGRACSPVPKPVGAESTSLWGKGWGAGLQ